MFSMTKILILVAALLLAGCQAPDTLTPLESEMAAAPKHWLLALAENSPNAEPEVRVEFTCAVLVSDLPKIIPLEVMERGELIGMRFQIRKGFGFGMPASPHLMLNEPDVFKRVSQEYAHMHRIGSSDPLKPLEELSKA